MSLFIPLKEEGLTFLRIRYDWKTDKSVVSAGKGWDNDFTFTKYKKDFYVESILSNDCFCLNNQETRKIFSKYNQLEYLDDIINLLRQGKHFGMDCYFYKKYDIRFIGNIHSRELGKNNGSHAVLSGGIRRHSLEDEEREVIVDGLNLSRAMSFKNAAAGINFGGCKTTVHMDELDLDNLDMMGFLAYALDSIRTFTGPDMGFPIEMSDVMNRHFTNTFTGGPEGPLGSTGTPTAYGTYLAMKQAAKYKFGTESLEGRKIAIQGLGSVGWHMAEYILGENVELYIFDLDDNVMNKLIEKYPNRKITKVRMDEILYIDVDILCPCAIGGVLTEENIPRLNCDIVFGPANNQLKASSRTEEERLSRVMADNDILFQIAWWHNTGGVLCGHEEYVNRQKASKKNLYAAIESVVPSKTWENLTCSAKLGITPTEHAYQVSDEVIYVK